MFSNEYFNFSGVYSQSFVMSQNNDHFSLKVEPSSPSNMKKVSFPFLEIMEENQASLERELFF